jgi:hypothetical protein
VGVGKQPNVGIALVGYSTRRIPFLRAGGTAGDYLDIRAFN